VALLGGNANRRKAVVVALVDVAARSFVHLFVIRGVSYDVVLSLYLVLVLCLYQAMKEDPEDPVRVRVDWQIEAGGDYR
jgi:hypothetical protein